MRFDRNRRRTVVATEDLTKEYGGRTAVSALSLEVHRGDVFGFLGRNGAGKSTTLRMVLGLVRPTRGRIHLLGEDLLRRPLRALRRVGAIVEAPAFHDHLSGWRNLSMLAALSGGAPRRRLEAVLELVDLSERAREPVSHYSHGMRQRLGIAQALLPNPELVILDEPTDGLDPQGIHEMRRLIVRLRDELGITVILSSHLLGEVEQVCSRLAILDRGRLLYQGETAALLGGNGGVRLLVDRPREAAQLLARDPSITIRSIEDIGEDVGEDVGGDVGGGEVEGGAGGALHIETHADRIAAINALLVRNRFAVREITPVRATLEEVFLRLTDEGAACNDAGFGAGR